MNNKIVICPACDSGGTSCGLCNDGTVSGNVAELFNREAKTMQDIPLKRLNKKEQELCDALIAKAKLFAAQGKRDTDYSTGWDRGASWAFAHSVNIIYEHSNEQLNNSLQLEIIEDFVKRAEENIAKTGKLESSHYAAMIYELKLLRKLNETGDKSYP